MSQRLEPRDDVLDHSMHAVRRKAGAERDDLGQVVSAFEEEAEEAPHPRADEEGAVCSEEVELEEEVVRREDGGDGGDPVLMSSILKRCLWKKSLKLDILCTIRQGSVAPAFGTKPMPWIAYGRQEVLFCTPLRA